MRQTQLLFEKLKGFGKTMLKSMTWIKHNILDPVGWFVVFNPLILFLVVLVFLPVIVWVCLSIGFAMLKVIGGM